MKYIFRYICIYIYIYIYISYTVLLAILRYWLGYLTFLLKRCIGLYEFDVLLYCTMYIYERMTVNMRTLRCIVLGQRKIIRYFFEPFDESTYPAVACLWSSAMDHILFEWGMNAKTDQKNLFLNNESLSSFSIPEME